MLHFIHKNVPRVFSVKSDSSICRNMNTNQEIGMSHSTQEPMESGRYHDIIIVTSSSWRHFLPSPRWRIHKNYQGKKDPTLPSLYTFFGLIFQKPLRILIKKLACHMARRSQWKVTAIMTSLSWHHHHDVIFCLHQDGGFTKTIGEKKRPNLAINLHIFWFDFSKAVNLY